MFSFNSLPTEDWMRIPRSVDCMIFPQKGRQTEGKTQAQGEQNPTTSCPTNIIFHELQHWKMRRREVTQEFPTFLSYQKCLG